MRAGLVPLAGLASGLPSVAVAVTSWIAAEFLAGCATYARAMYPALALNDLTDPVGPESHEPKPTAPARPKNAKPDLRLISTGNAESTGRSRASQLLYSDQSGKRAETDAVLLRERKPAARSGWRAAIVAAAIRLWSKVRQTRARRRANSELRRLGERLPDNVGTSRLDVKSIVRCGARIE